MKLIITIHTIKYLAQYLHQILLIKYLLSYTDYLIQYVLD